MVTERAGIHPAWLEARAVKVQQTMNQLLPAFRIGYWTPMANQRAWLVAIPRANFSLAEEGIIEGEDAIFGSEMGGTGNAGGFFADGAALGLAAPVPPYSLW